MNHCTFHCTPYSIPNITHRPNSFKQFMDYMITLLVYYICLVKMQLNDVIKSIDWYQPFVAILIQVDVAKNSIDTGVGIGIGQSIIWVKSLKIHSLRDTPLLYQFTVYIKHLLLFLFIKTYQVTVKVPNKQYMSVIHKQTSVCITFKDLCTRSLPSNYQQMFLTK